MSFAIEVPGGANPLSFQDLCRTLSSATTSLDYAQRQAAEQQLTSWETTPGYYSSLQAVYLDKSLPIEPRFQAVIQLKNGIDKHWRHYAATKQGISPDEKNAIRQRLFEGTVDEVEERLAEHNAYVTAKIVRIDYPSDWPDALSQIISLLRSSRDGDQRKLFGSLQILLQVVKELGTARLKKSQTALQSVTPEIVHVLLEIYTERSELWINYLTNRKGDEQAAYLAMSNSLIALKVLRRLVLVGYERPHGDETVTRFWGLSQNQFGKLLGFVSEEAGMPEQFQKVAAGHLIQFTKLHINMAEQHPASFANLPDSLSLVHAYWDLVSKFAEVYGNSGGIRQNSGSGSAKAKVEGPLPEKLAVKGLLLLRACVRIAFMPVQTFKYRSPETKAEQEAARAMIKTELFKPDLVVQIVNCIITYLFVFRKSDLEAWEEDPEEWEKEQQSESDAYEWQVRPCAERLFLDLLTQFKDLLIQPLMSYFQSAQDPQSDIATKEAVYTAMGNAAAHVVNVFDFDAFLATTVLQDAQQTGALNKVLRRRIAILLSQWAPVKLADESRPIVYQIFRHFLDPNDEANDLVVRITTARQLRWIADELDFSVDSFLPYTADVLSQLITLIQHVEVDETKLAILESVRIIVTRMEDQVSQFGDQLMSNLPSVWENTGNEEYMIKQAVIAIFAALVMSMGTASQRYQHLMVPLISEAVRQGSDLHVHLIDESLELWNAVLMQSTAPLSPELIGLAEMALPLLEYSSLTAGEALNAVESYILFAPSAMLEDRLRRPTLTALLGILDSKSREQVRSGTTCIEYLIRSAVDLGGSSGVTLIIQDMVELGFLQKILGDLHNAWEAHQTTGPNRKISKLNTVTESDYLAIIARLALAEPTVFTQMIDSLGGLESTWSWLSAEWFEQAHDMDNIERQKLYLLALTRLLELPSPVQELTLGKLQDYFLLWTNVIAELQDGRQNATDCLILETPEPTEYDTPKLIAERGMMMRDPIHTIHAYAFVRERLQDLVARVGGEAAFEEQWAVNVDGDVMMRFREVANSMQ
ncbi:putative importin 11 [Emericellopsis atlantica]|uniref:Importin 11 n=1 Tax=Emericellopsis atlantica TaxID=2614577 RepID=A0A9P7ZPI4_9HYPO|nr:putative importin 11 [Emericellopsis atlantica]KAG9255893.1 putative importin 11 [Emericellopsis atlantica]